MRPRLKLLIDAKREREKALTRARRAADMRACRKLQAAGIALFHVAADATTYDMMVRYAGLDPSKVGNKEAVRDALGRLLRAGLKALVELETLRRR